MQLKSCCVAEIVKLSCCVWSTAQFVALTTENIAACLNVMDKAGRARCLQLQQGVETHGGTFDVRRGREEFSQMA